MRFILSMSLLLLSIVAHSEIIKPSEESAELSNAVDNLISSINDVYSYSPARKVFSLPDKKVAVIFVIEGRGHGNNYQQYLAVFSSSQRSKLISGETYEYHGPLKYSLVGVLNVGAKSKGGVSTKQLEYTKNKLTLAVVAGRWGSELLKTAGLPKNSNTVNVSIGHYGLVVE